MTDIIRQLRYIQEKYKNDIVSTGRVVISDLARDCANEIERLQKEILKYKEKAAKYKAERDKAVEDLSKFKECAICKHCQDQVYCYNNCQQHFDEIGIRTYPKWEWRGLEDNNG